MNKDWSSFPAFLFVFVLITYNVVRAIFLRRCPSCRKWKGKKSGTHQGDVHETRAHDPRSFAGLGTRTTQHWTETTLYRCTVCNHTWSTTSPRSHERGRR